MKRSVGPASPPRGQMSTLQRPRTARTNALLTPGPWPVTVTTLSTCPGWKALLSCGERGRGHSRGAQPPGSCGCSQTLLGIRNGHVSGSLGRDALLNSRDDRQPPRPRPPLVVPCQHVLGSESEVSEAQLWAQAIYTQHPLASARDSETMRGPAPCTAMGWGSPHPAQPTPAAHRWASFTARKPCLFEA